MNPINQPISGGGDRPPSANKDAPGRRDFLRTALPLGVLCGMGCPRLSALFLKTPGLGDSQKQKATQDSGMSYEDVFNFAYRDGAIPLTKKMAELMGQDAFLDFLGTAASEAMREIVVGFAAQVPDNHLSVFAESMRNPAPLYQNVLSQEIVEDSEDAFEVRTTECLWAKTYRDSDASEIGYAGICHTDFAIAEGFKLRMTRTKTLMQGDECCNPRWVLADL